MYKDERDIYYYDVLSRAWNRKYKNGLNPIPHYELAKAVKNAYGHGVGEKTKPNGQAVYITAIRIFDNRCEFLIGFTDPVAADPTLNDHPAKRRRIIEKVGNEGLEHSAHIIWNYGSRLNIQPCPFYLEGAVGLSSTVVARFLNYLLREYSLADKDAFIAPDPEGGVDPEGNFKTVPVRPKIELIGHPSQEFIKDLQAGTLSEVELYTETGRANPWDANAYVLEDRRSVLIKPNAAKHLPNAKDLLDRLFKPRVRNEFEFARVAFKTEGEVSRNVRIHSRNYNLINDDSYVKKTRISGFGATLPNAFENIYRPIMVRMRDLAGI